MAKKDYTIKEINYKEAYEDLYADVAGMLSKRLGEVEEDAAAGDDERTGCFHALWMLNKWDYLRSNYPTPYLQQNIKKENNV